MLPFDLFELCGIVMASQPMALVHCSRSAAHSLLAVG